MKSETLCYDVNRYNQMLTRRINSIEEKSKNLINSLVSTSPTSGTSSDVKPDISEIKLYISSNFAT